MDIVIKSERRHLLFTAKQEELEIRECRCCLYGEEIKDLSGVVYEGDKKIGKVYYNEISGRVNSNISEASVENFPKCQAFIINLAQKIKEL